MRKKIPTFKSDHAAAVFVDQADLAQNGLSGARLTRFEIKPKDKSINLRLSGERYGAVSKRAAHEGIPYQRFIRLILEQAIGGRNRRRSRNGQVTGRFFAPSQSVPVSQRVSFASLPESL
jgi:predicted DNA binding CopG/RHH family protein